jgi:hypothetical protein
MKAPSAHDRSNKAPNATDFNLIFVRLRALLEPHAARLKISADTPAHYCLEVPFSAKFQKGFPIAWVKISKAYVSYHFMPVYMFPTLREGMSDRLKARMQGKSCFNFKVADEALLKELERITQEGFAMSRELDAKSSLAR